MLSLSPVLDRDVHEAFLVETETLKPETEAETEALTIQAVARPSAPRDGLETEASRPIPLPSGHPQCALILF